MVYAEFTKGPQASKAIAAQYLANRLKDKHDEGSLDVKDLRAWLPKYLVEAIEYVTPTGASPTTSDQTAPGNE